MLESFRLEAADPGAAHGSVAAGAAPWTGVVFFLEAKKARNSLSLIQRWMDLPRPGRRPAQPPRVRARSATAAVSLLVLLVTWVLFRVLRCATDRGVHRKLFV